jgi:hypothetical protein
VHNVRKPICQLACLALGISCGLCLSQTPNGAGSAGGEAAVHLEPHAGRTTFRIGEPVILDLVFASGSPGYVVETDDNPYLPVSDQVDVAPDGGWVRTHSTFRGQAINFNAMQLTLFEEAWRDPKVLPTDVLQTALRQARELTQKDWVTDDSVMWAGTPEQRQATLQEYQREVNQIIATLPLRSETNRAETIKFLKALAVPNPFNQSQSPTPLSR